MTTFNLGLSTIPSIQSPTNWAYESLYDISSKLLDHLTTIHNLLTIQRSLKTYGKTPQLRELVEKSFEAAGVTFSNEGIIETARKFFNWVKEKLVQLKDWFVGLFTSSKKKSEKIDEMSKATAEIDAAINSNDKGRLRAAYDRFKGWFKRKGTPSEESLALSMDPSTEGLTEFFRIFRMTIYDPVELRKSIDIVMPLFDVSLPGVWEMFKASGLEPERFGSVNMTSRVGELTKRAEFDIQNFKLPQKVDVTYSGIRAVYVRDVGLPNLAKKFISKQEDVAKMLELAEIQMPWAIKQLEHATVTNDDTLMNTIKNLRAIISFSTKMISLSDKIVNVIYEIHTKLMNAMLNACGRVLESVPTLG